MDYSTKIRVVFVPVSEISEPIVGYIDAETRIATSIDGKTVINVNNILHPRIVELAGGKTLESNVEKRTESRLLAENKRSTRYTNNWKKTRFISKPRSTVRLNTPRTISVNIQTPQMSIDLTESNEGTTKLPSIEDLIGPNLSRVRRKPEPLRIPKLTTQNSIMREISGLKELPDVESRNVIKNKDVIDEIVLETRGSLPKGRANYFDITHLLTLPQASAAQAVSLSKPTFVRRWKESVGNRKWPYRLILKLDRQIRALKKFERRNGASPESAAKIERIKSLRAKALEPTRIRL